MPPACGRCGKERGTGVASSLLPHPPRELKDLVMCRFGDLRNGCVWFCQVSSGINGSITKSPITKLFLVGFPAPPAKVAEDPATPSWEDGARSVDNSCCKAACLLEPMGDDARRWRHPGPQPDGAKSGRVLCFRASYCDPPRLWETEALWNSLSPGCL